MIIGNIAGWTSPTSRGLSLLPDGPGLIALVRVNATGIEVRQIAAVESVAESAGMVGPTLCAGISYTEGVSWLLISSREERDRVLRSLRRQGVIQNG